MSKGIWIILALIVIAYIANTDSNIETTQAKPASELTRAERIDRGWMANGSFFPLVKAVSKDMQDPKSFEHVDTKSHDDGKELYLVMTYRGKNALGATVTEEVKAKYNPTTNTITIQ